MGGVLLVMTMEKRCCMVTSYQPAGHDDFTKFEDLVTVFDMFFQSFSFSFAIPFSR